MSNILIKLENAVFKNLNSKIFKSPVSFRIKTDENWAIVGSYKGQLLKALASQYISEPPLSRTYPFLNKTQWPFQVIQFLEFKGVLPTAHLSARYEYFKDEFDQTTKKFIIGETFNNKDQITIDDDKLAAIFRSLQINGLEDRWIMGLSNGQGRRARLAKALIHSPKILILDDPFLGLDPTATGIVSDVLSTLIPNPHVILGLRYQDAIPDWITNVAIVDETGIIAQGSKEEIVPKINELKVKDELLQKEQLALLDHEGVENIKKLFGNGKSLQDNHELMLEFKGISVSYRGQPVLKDLHWKVGPGERWHIRGNNGTGKSTLLSLITADHPQSWNSKIVIKGEPRKTGKHSYFGINSQIGFVSPELHSIFPGGLSLYDSISTGFVVGSFIPPKNKMTQTQLDQIELYLKEFDLQEKRDIPFRELSISDQKLVLFIRALIKNPDILILDEALSVMDDVRIEQCKKILEYFPGTILAIGHLQNELPNCQKFIRLIGPGEYEVGEV